MADAYHMGVLLQGDQRRGETTTFSLASVTRYCGRKSAASGCGLSSSTLTFNPSEDRCQPVGVGEIEWDTSRALEYEPDVGLLRGVGAVSQGNHFTEPHLIPSTAKRSRDESAPVNLRVAEVLLKIGFCHADT